MTEASSQCVPFHASLTPGARIFEQATCQTWFHTRSHCQAIRSSRAAGGEAADNAVLTIRAGRDLLRLLAGVVAGVLVADLVLVLAAVGDGARVPVVCVDAAEHAAVAGEDVVHDDVPGAAVAAAVAAAADDLAVVLGVEVLDVERAEAVELEDLVVGLEGAAADDVGSAAGLLDGSARVRTCMGSMDWGEYRLTGHLRIRPATRR